MNKRIAISLKVKKSDIKCLLKCIHLGKKKKQVTCSNRVFDKVSYCMYKILIQNASLLHCEFFLSSTYWFAPISCYLLCRISRPEVFYRTNILSNFGKLIGKLVYWSNYSKNVQTYSFFQIRQKVYSSFELLQVFLNCEYSFSLDKILCKDFIGSCKES